MRARLESFAQRHGPALCASALASGWFFVLGYGPTLAPDHIAWMLRSDWAAYLWGHLFFRNADWAFPLGDTPALFYPFGTSVGFTDANPWLSVLCKLLSPLLPVDFQFSGLWFLLCFVLQAWFGTKVAATLSQDRVQQALGGALFAVTPLLPARSAHVALCALFFVTAGIHLHLRPLASRADVRRAALFAAFMLVWAAGTHGYLSAMLLALVLAWLLRLSSTDGLLSPAQGALYALAALGLTVATYWLFGYVGWKPTDLTAEGFGQFSGDLTALVNPQKWSRFFGALPFRPRQWEGFLYLGAGVCGALLVALTRVGTIGRPQLRRVWALALVVFLMWLYSLSSKVAFLGDTVLDLEPLYRPFASLTGIFRTSGRFAWPLHLALIALAIAGAARLPRAWLGRLLLGFALLLQMVELDRSRLDFSDVPLTPLRDPAWAGVGHDYAHLRLVPIHLLWVCKYDARLVNRLSYAAYRERLSFNSGNFMRKEPGVARLCKQGLRPDESLRPDTVYVVERAKLRDFRARAATCGSLDGLAVCVSGDRATRLATALASHPLPP